MTDGLTVAVVGATGAVGEEMRAVLGERRFPVRRLVPLASARSAGGSVDWRGNDVRVELLDEDSFRGVDLALFSAGTTVSEQFAAIAVKAGCVVVDNTCAFRMDKTVPLVVPEVNREALDDHKGIIANPNCSTIQMVVPLAPLHRAAGIKRIVVCSYQAASGAGRAAMDELRDQTVALLNFREPRVEQFQRRLAFDVIPEIDVFMPEGDTREERKMVDETRKIMGLPDLPVSATCVRVPVFVGHCLAVNVEFERPLDAADARALLLEAEGIEMDVDPNAYATTADVAGRDETFVGRVRDDASVAHGLNMWVAADNLRKGAATNAVQIAEDLLTRQLMRVP